MLRLHRICAIVLLALSASLPAKAHADTLDTILNILYTAGVVDGAVVQAKPLIQCLVDGNSVSSCSQQYASQQAGAAISASDPKIRLVIDIILAANNGNWATVVELTGVDLLVQLACSSGMPGGGPVKDFICGGVFAQVAQLGKPVVREVLIAVGNRDWWRLVSLVGPDLACSVIPSSVPLKDQICGPLGAVLATVADIASDAAEGAAQLANDVYEMFDGESPHMSYDNYYKIYLRDSVHTRVVERLAINRSGLGLNSDQWNKCVDYFDSHEQANDTAKKTCKDLGNRLHNESMLLVNAIAPAPMAYFDTHFKNADILRSMAAENYRTNIINDHKQFINSVQLTDQSFSWIAKSPLAATIKPLYMQCKDTMLSRFPITPQGVMRMDIPPNVWDLVCWQAVAIELSSALQVERLRLAVNVIPALENAGCSETSHSGSNALLMSCNNYPALNQCLQTFEGYRKQHCKVDPLAADKMLAKEIITAVSPKRCFFRKTGKGGKYDPAVVCTRPWMKPLCEDALKQAYSSNTYMRTSLSCSYYESPQYKAAIQKTVAIKNALNAEIEDKEEESAETSSTSQTDGRTAAIRSNRGEEEDKKFKPGVIGKMTKVETRPDMRAVKPGLAVKIANCTITPEDPLAITCKEPEVVWQLPQRLPGAELPFCKADPKHEGQDVPCYSGTLPLPQQQIVIPANARSKGMITLPGQNKTADALPPQRDTYEKPTDLKLVKPAVKPVGVRSVQKPKADLAAASAVRVGNRSVRWRSKVTLSDSALQAKAGKCKLPLSYTLINQGTAPSSMTQGSWTARGINSRHSQAALAVGVKMSVNANLQLPPGTHNLQLVLDSSHSVDETNENNNRYNLSVVIQGSCGAAKGTAPVRKMVKPGAVISR